MGDAIVVESLGKRYGDVTAVDDVDLRVAEGTVFAFLGPNGAGKTTTVEILEGLRQATSGRARVLDLDPWTDGRALHRRIGVMPQDFRFLEKITPQEAIRYYATLFDCPADPPALLAQVELTEKANARFDTLSGGQKQKLGLALALVNRPEVCFLDEPTTGLDPHARRAIWQVIRTLKSEGTTVFLTTHYLEEAELLADRVAIIHQGRIIASGTPASIIHEHGRPERLVIEGPPELAERFRRELGFDVTRREGRIEIPYRNQQELFRALHALEASAVSVSGMATRSDTLEDVFVSLVGQMDDGVLKSTGSA